MKCEGEHLSVGQSPLGRGGRLVCADRNCSASVRDALEPSRRVPWFGWHQGAWVRPRGKRVSAFGVKRKRFARVCFFGCQGASSIGAPKFRVWRFRASGSRKVPREAFGAPPSLKRLKRFRSGDLPGRLTAKQSRVWESNVGPPSVEIVPR